MQEPLEKNLRRIPSIVIQKSDVERLCQSNFTLTENVLINKQKKNEVSVNLVNQRGFQNQSKKDSTNNKKSYFDYVQKNEVSQNQQQKSFSYYSKSILKKQKKHREFFCQALSVFKCQISKWIVKRKKHIAQDKQKIQFLDVFIDVFNFQFDSLSRKVIGYIVNEFQQHCQDITNTLEQHDEKYRQNKSQLSFSNNYKLLSRDSRSCIGCISDSINYFFTTTVPYLQSSLNKKIEKINQICSQDRISKSNDYYTQPLTGINYRIISINDEILQCNSQYFNKQKTQIKDIKKQIIKEKTSNSIAQLQKQKFANSYQNQGNENQIQKPEKLLKLPIKFQCRQQTQIRRKSIQSNKIRQNFTLKVLDLNQQLSIQKKKLGTGNNWKNENKQGNMYINWRRSQPFDRSRIYSKPQKQRNKIRKQLLDYSTIKQKQTIKKGAKRVAHRNYLN